MVLFYSAFTCRGLKLRIQPDNVVHLAVPVYTMRRTIFVVTYQHLGCAASIMRDLVTIEHDRKDE